MKNNYRIRSYQRVMLPLFIIGTVISVKSMMAQNETGSYQHQPEIIVVDGWGAEIKVNMTPNKPNLGDEVEITCLLMTPYKSLPESKIIFMLHKGAKLISGREVYIHPPLKKGETAEFSIKIKVVSRLLQVSVGAYARISPEVKDFRMAKLLLRF